MQMVRRYKNIKKRIVKFSESNTIREQSYLFDTYMNNIPAIKTGKVTIYIGDVKRCLRLLPDSLVDCVITSPPYWKQRDYKDPQQIGQESSYQKYIKDLVDVFNETKRVLKPTGTLFLNIGYKYRNKELLLIPELLAIELQKNGWVLLNKIIWYKPNAMPSSLDSRFSNVYEPIFLFVKEENKYRYYLSVDELRSQASNFVSSNRKPEDILGFGVENSLLKDKKVKGKVAKVFRDRQNNIFIEVRWENNERNIGLVNDFDKESQIKIDLICLDCEKNIKHEIDIDEHKNCKGFPRPVLPPAVSFNNRIELKSSSLFHFDTVRRVYNGKYKINPDSRGASPGARKSLFGEYLVLQRRYKIFQPIIADYLRFWRKKKNITIKEIDRSLGYKDTAGHWFRKDTGSWGEGGSIPLPCDWFRLKELLEFNDIYDRWVTETHFVLQTVKAHPKGRNPGDMWTIKLQPLPEAHFATFPEELVTKCVKAGSPKDAVVLDPFAGSGTTAKVSQDLGRDVILIELISDYIDIIIKRCRNIKEVIHVE